MFKFEKKCECGMQLQFGIGGNDYLSNVKGVFVGKDVVVISCPNCKKKHSNKPLTKHQKEMCDWNE